VERNQLFNRRKPLKERSADAAKTGAVKSICSNIFIVQKFEIQKLYASAAVVGG